VATWPWPGRSCAKKMRDGSKYWTRWPVEAQPNKKNLYLCISITFLLDFCMNVPNSCVTRKDKYYAFLNVLKFEEYIVYMKVQIWIWWKCWIINLSSNSPKFLLNFMNLLKFSNLLNIESFIVKIYFKRWVGSQACTYTGWPRRFSSRWKCEAVSLACILPWETSLNELSWSALSYLLLRFQLGCKAPIYMV